MSGGWAGSSSAEQNSRVESLERTLSGIAITLGLETWEDLPVGDSKAILRAVERALNARSLASFVRGQRAARAADGVDPDALPEGELLTREKICGAVTRGWCHPLNQLKSVDTDLVRAITNAVCKLLSSKGARPLQTGALKESPETEGMSEREKIIRREMEAHPTAFLDPDAARYLFGVIDVIREDRNRLLAKSQSEINPDPTSPLTDVGTLDLCCCRARHGDSQCKKFLGHVGPHQNGKEVWGHA